VCLDVKRMEKRVYVMKGREGLGREEHAFL
jgi:hypothetical protein